MDPSTICLHTAVKANDVPLLQHLLEHGGCNPNTFLDGENAFHVAVSSGSVECLYLLLKYSGCDPHARSRSNYMTPIELGQSQIEDLTEASDKAYRIDQCVEILRRTPSYVQTTFEVYRSFCDEDTQLVEAIEKKDLEKFKFYIDDNPSLLSSFPFPLFFCIEHHFDEAIEWAVGKYNLDLEVRNLEGLTLFGFAVLNSNRSCYPLMSYGASARAEICPGIIVEDVINRYNLFDGLFDG